MIRKKDVSFVAGVHTEVGLRAARGQPAASTGGPTSQRSLQARPQGGRSGLDRTAAAGSWRSLSVIGPPGCSFPPHVLLNRSLLPNLTSWLLITQASPEPSPLHDAVAAGDVAAVRSLLAAGHSTATVDANWDVPLQLAAALPSPEVAEVLLAAGANPNARNKLWGDTPLCTAVHAGRLACVETLLAAGADTQLCGRKLSAGPQRVAALRLKHGLESNVVVAAAACAAPHTPLFYAAAGGHLPIARALLRAGAELLPAESHSLPGELRGAALMHKLEVVRALRAVGADLGDPSSEALYAQAWGGELEAVQCWVVAGGWSGWGLCWPLGCGWGCLAMMGGGTMTMCWPAGMQLLSCSMPLFSLEHVAPSVPGAACRMQGPLRLWLLWRCHQLGQSWREGSWAIGLPARLSTTATTVAGR